MLSWNPGWHATKTRRGIECLKRQASKQQSKQTIDGRPETADKSKRVGEERESKASKKTTKKRKRKKQDFFQCPPRQPLLPFPMAASYVMLHYAISVQLDHHANHPLPRAGLCQAREIQGD